MEMELKEVPVSENSSSDTEMATLNAIENTKPT